MNNKWAESGMVMLMLSSLFNCIFQFTVVVGSLYLWCF